MSAAKQPRRPPEHHEASHGCDPTFFQQAAAERDIVVEVLRLTTASNDTHELMRAATDLLHEWSGCEAVGIRLQAGEDYPYFETRGFPPEFV